MAFDVGTDVVRVILAVRITVNALSLYYIIGMSGLMHISREIKFATEAEHIGSALVVAVVVVISHNDE